MLKGKDTYMCWSIPQFLRFLDVSKGHTEVSVVSLQFASRNACLFLKPKYVIRRVVWVQGVGCAFHCPQRSLP